MAALSTCPTGVAAGWPWSNAAKAPDSAIWTTTAISMSSSSIVARFPLCSAMTRRMTITGYNSSSGARKPIATASALASQSSPVISSRSPKCTAVEAIKATLAPGSISASGNTTESTVSRSAGTAAALTHRRTYPPIASSSSRGKLTSIFRSGISLCHALPARNATDLIHLTSRRHRVGRPGFSLFCWWRL